MYRSSYVLIPWIISYRILSYKLDRFDETFPKRCNIEFLDNVLDNNDLSDNINPKCATDFDLKKKLYFLLPTDSSSLQQQLSEYFTLNQLVEAFPCGKPTRIDSLRQKVLSLRVIGDTNRSGFAAPTLNKRLAS